MTVSRDKGVSFNNLIQKFCMDKINLEFSFALVRGILNSKRKCFLDSGIRTTLHHLKRILL